VKELAKVILPIQESVDHLVALGFLYIKQQQVKTFYIIKNRNPVVVFYY
jgi:hypothetical protein